MAISTSASLAHLGAGIAIGFGAVGAGLGHGGIEAIVIVGMTYINNLLYSAMINTGAFDTMVESTAQMGVDENTLKNSFASNSINSPLVISLYCADSDARRLPFSSNKHAFKAVVPKSTPSKFLDILFSYIVFNRIYNLIINFN